MVYALTCIADEGGARGGIRFENRRRRHTPRRERSGPLGLVLLPQEGAPSFTVFKTNAVSLVLAFEDLLGVKRVSSRGKLLLMTEAPPQNADRNNSERQPLFETLGRNKFVQHLESLGIQITNREENNEQRLDITFPAGVYDVEVAFPKVDPDDKRYFYGNLPTEKQELALNLDTQHPAFLMLRNELLQALSGRVHSVVNIVTALKTIVEKRLANDLADEHVSSLSEIIQKGRTACAGMVAVTGMLAKNIAPELSVTAITGSPLQFTDRVPVDFHHEWLRFSDGTNVVVYDPFYKRLELYDAQSPTVSESDPFVKYQVFAWGVGSFAKSHDYSLSANVTMIESHDKTGDEPWVIGDESASAQIFGEIPFAIRIPSAAMTLVDGCIELSRKPTNRASGRHLIPILKLGRRKEA